MGIDGADDAGLLARIGAVAQQAGLGGHRAGYVSGRSKVESDAIRAGVIVVVLAVLTGVGMATKAGWAMAAAIGVAVFGVGFVIAGLASLRYLGGNKGVRLDLFDGGLVAARKDGLRVARYAETAVRQKIVHYTRSNRTHYTYWVTDVDGATVVLRENFADPQQWGPAIQAAVTDAQVPKAWAELEVGRRVEFGPLWVSDSEIGSGQKSAAWAQIERIGLSPDTVRVDVQGKLLSGISTETQQVPNIYVFRAVADRLCAIHGRAGAVTP